ncbi:hypothetical protein Psuf_056120 [Phytohabitans suffuscus]|uniref:Uncharacterized protein n=1 Tax=Phytohabitans suffuscus TaxID=624315 RepID=A0A6F8YQH0_9ACTN|nr:hypothetical protein Psuf_056120 [Phytohabitans suffuscus]
MLPITLMLPAASVRRTVPLRAVWITERSGSTASAIGSPTSPTPLAGVTRWKSAALIGCACAGAAVAPTEIAAPATAGSAAEPAACARRCLRARGGGGAGPRRKSKMDMVVGSLS